MSVITLRPFAAAAVAFVFAATAGAQQTATPATPSQDVHTLITNVVHDQKQTFVSFPKQVSKGKHWIPVVALSAVTGALIIADQYDSPYFRRNTTFKGFDSALSSTNTGIGIIATPAIFYAAGSISKNDYTKQTALLTAEAAIDGEIAGVLLKLVTDRRRPEYIGTRGNFADTFGDSKTILDSGFPSGHAIGAFSVATVVARRYGQRHRWAPFVAYGLATAVGFSRISGATHFPADVFLGAAMGYGIARYGVLRQ
jgi:membrane-associated phospholipid phosphatase